MGIYDREYIRGESSGTGLFSGVTPVTKSIIAINVLMLFLENLLQWDSRGFTASWLAASPELTFHHLRLHELLTNTFVHMGPSALMGLIFDMWFFWMIGREMESLYGSRDFLVFYLASALVSTTAGLAVAAAAGLDGALIFGSWGPILAVMTLYTLYYPKREILFLFFIPMPMWVLLSIYTVIPVLGHFSGTGSPGIGVGMILAGAGFAYAYKQFDWRLSRLIAGRTFRPRLRIFSSVDYDQARPRGWGPSRSSSSVGGGGRSPSVSVLPEEQLDARLDEILAKIARDGSRDNLTEEERRVLEEASRRARNRRSDRI
jgi:membrane associated rhomboid family serine protease